MRYKNERLLKPMTEKQNKMDGRCQKNEDHQYIRIVILQVKLLEGMLTRNLNFHWKRKNLGKFQRIYIRTNEAIEEIDPQKGCQGQRAINDSRNYQESVTQWDEGVTGRRNLEDLPHSQVSRSNGDPKTKRGSVTPHHPLTLRIQLPRADKGLHWVAPDKECCHLGQLIGLLRPPS